jgi:hypothetical protein
VGWGGTLVAASGKNGTQEGARWADLAALAAEQLWSGHTTRQVVRALEEQGLAHAAAEALVERVEDELRRGGAL